MRLSAASLPGGIYVESLEIELCHEELKVGPLIFTQLDINFK